MFRSALLPELRDCQNAVEVFPTSSGLPDPGDSSVQIFLTHNMLEQEQMASGIRLGAWSAIAKFHELACA